MRKIALVVGGVITVAAGAGFLKAAYETVAEEFKARKEAKAAALVHAQQA